MFCKNYRVNSCFVRLQGNSCFVKLQGNSCFVRISSPIQYGKYIPIIFTIYTEHNSISQVTLVTSVLIRRSLLFTKQRLDTILLFTMQRLDTGVDKDFIHILFPRLPLNTEFSSLSSHLVILSTLRRQQWKQCIILTKVCLAADLRLSSQKSLDGGPELPHSNFLTLSVLHLMAVLIERIDHFNNKYVFIISTYSIQSIVNTIH